MIIALIIISCLALLAAVADMILFFTEKKRNKAEFMRMESWRRTALDYIESADENTLTSAKVHSNKLFEAFMEKTELEYKAFREGYCIEKEQEILELRKEIEELKKGMCPDYEAALSAAKAVNDFNMGISGILNFDPIAAARKQRLGNEGGDE